MAASDAQPLDRGATALLLSSVFVVGLCTIVYELLIGSVSSYLVGDSITQFSITIGLSMSAMGFGTYLSRLLRTNLLTWFVGVEITLGLLGGLCVPILYAVYATSALYMPAMITLILAIGVLIGIEIPVLTRLLSETASLRFNLSNVLSLDYFGALLATLLFPFVLLPFLGVFRSGLVAGLLNMGVGIATLWFFRRQLSPVWAPRLRRIAAMATVTLLLGLLASPWLLNAWQASLFDDRVVWSKQSPYQKLVLTRDRDDVRLFLEGHLQFSSVDEHRYHESLVHVPMGAAPRRDAVLILGGGDGLAVREVLKYDDVKSITVVDLDPAVTALARTHPLVRRLNEDSFEDPRVTVQNGDAFQFLRDAGPLFDVVIVDLPDPNNVSLSRLYSQAFFHALKKRLSRTGIMVTQATSPFFATDAYWCIVETLRSVEFGSVLPYHAYVPSMGDWGFVMASAQALTSEDVDLRVPTRFLDAATAESLFVFPKDLIRRGLEPSTLNEPRVLSHYLEGWQHWN